MGTLRKRVEDADDRGCSRSDLLTGKAASPSRKLQEEALRALEKGSDVFGIGPKTRQRYIGKSLIGRLYLRSRRPATGVPGLELTEQQLRAFYELDRHRREGLSSLPILWAWKRYAEYCDQKGGAADSEHFHATLARLAKLGRIDLVVHSDPSKLAEEERALLRPREDGSLPYYWMPRET